tara:strand:- start:25471 stop:25743 length:273 start_codon:yes stop_codon:yes gene_type:complete
MKSSNRFIFLFIAYLAIAGGIFYEFTNLNAAVESVRQENQINQGQAVYMPGASCVIKATADIDLQKFKDLAAACSMKHMEYLEGIKTVEK